MIDATRTIGDELGDILSERPEAVRERELRTLEDLLRANNNRVVLFGSGSAGARALSCLRSIGVEPLAFADSTPATWGRTVDGMAVLSPAEAATRFGSDALFIVSIWNAKHRFATTKKQLHELGARAVAPMSSVQWRFPEHFLPFFSLDLPHRLVRERAEIARAAELWADDRSRAEYLAHIRWRASGDFDAVPAPVSEMQYFPDFFELSPSEVFIDCGAYDGDTLREFLKRSRGIFRHVLSVEPGPDTFAALQTSIAALPASVRDRVAIERVAVGERRETLRFDVGDGTGGHVSDAGACVVEGTTLDRLCAPLRTTYIKMDIEGAEGAALAGGRNTIVRDRPILAICVYHRPTDLWRLPLFVHDLVPDYRMYLRSHLNDGWDTVAYAVPPERVAARAGAGT